MDSLTHLVGDVVDGDVMHGGRVVLEQGVQVRAAVSATRHKR